MLAPQPMQLRSLPFPPPDPSLAPPAEPGVPFEGVEKRLVVFYSTAGAAARGVPLPSTYTETEWQAILDHAHCEICSVRRLGDTTVYLLSESTLTVWPNGFLMKTCGRTTPFLALRCLIDFYGLEPMTEAIDWLVYSRLDFLHPAFQVWPHQNFPQEQEFLSRYFVDVKPFESNAGDHTMFGLFARPYALRPLESPFRTEEALLLGVDPHCVRLFTGYDHREEYEASDGSALGSVIRPVMDQLPSFELDEHWFTPCGYSANALTKATDGDEDYFSTHISPEPETSFASLEISKRSLKSAFPTGASGLAFASMVPAFRAREIHATVVAVLPPDGCDPGAGMISDAMQFIQFNLTHATSDVIHLGSCRLFVRHLRFLQDREPLMSSLGLLGLKPCALDSTANSNDETSACSNDLSDSHQDSFDFPRVRKFTA